MPAHGEWRNYICVENLIYLWIVWIPAIRAMFRKYIQNWWSGDAGLRWRQPKAVSLFPIYVRIRTFVQRKSGIKLRVFADHIAEFQELLNAFPRRMKTEIRKASVCKRLLDPNDCNPRCRMGYTFVMEREQYQKCRYMAFLLTLNEESHPYILQLLHKELDRVDSESWG